jgi:hypothetical protein
MIMDHQILPTSQGSQLDEQIAILNCSPFVDSGHGQFLQEHGPLMNIPKITKIKNIE